MRIQQTKHAFNCIPWAREVVNGLVFHPSGLLFTFKIREGEKKVRIEIESCVSELGFIMSVLLFLLV